MRLVSDQTVSSIPWTVVLCGAIEGEAFFVGSPSLLLVRGFAVMRWVWLDRPLGDPSRPRVSRLYPTKICRPNLSLHMTSFVEPPF